MQIQSKQSQFYGLKINLPIAGVVDIDVNGMVEVTDEVAEILLTNQNDWANPNIVDEEDEETAKNTGSTTNVSNAEMLASVDAMPLNELLALCKEAKIKGYTKLQGNEKALRALVKNQLAKAGK